MKTCIPEVINVSISNCTRSKTSQFIKSYSFDESSKEWNKNKIKCSNCTYKYKINYQKLTEFI